MIVDPEHGFTARLVYTEPMLRRAVGAFMARRMVRSAIGGAIAFCAVGACVLYLFGSRGFLFGVAIAASVMLGMVAIAIWRTHLKATLGRFRALPGGEAELVATHADATFRSSEGVATLPWHRFNDVFGIGDCWLLFTAPAQFVTVPLSGLNGDARAFLVDRLPPFSIRRPEPPAGRLTRLEILAIAAEAARAVYPTSMMAESFGFVTPKADAERLIWSVATQTIGSQLVVEIDDGTGAVLAIRRAGIR